MKYAVTFYNLDRDKVVKTAKTLSGALTEARKAIRNGSLSVMIHAHKKAIKRRKPQTAR